AGGEESLIEINPEAKNWYVPVSKASTSYVAELGYCDEKGEWTSITHSTPATTPADALSEQASAAFATVPFHLTFQRLVDMVRETMLEGETLVGALARLQGEGRRLLFAHGITPDWTDEQRRVLAALIGP